MAGALVQTVEANQLTSNVQSVTPTYASTTAGNLLLCYVLFRNAAATITAPANWVQLGIVQAQGQTLVCFAYPNNPGGITTAQFSTTATATAMSAIATEWSGAVTASVLDKTANNNGSSVTMDSGTTATTTQAAEIWYAALGYNAGSARTLSGTTNGFTKNVNSDSTNTTSGGARLSDYYLIANALSTANVSETLSSSSTWVGLIVTIFDATINATASVGGSGGIQASGIVQGTVLVGGSGGVQSASQAQGTVAVGGSGGIVSSAQTQGTVAVGGTGGVGAAAQTQNSVALGGSGGVQASVYLIFLGTASVGGSGGVQAAAILITPTYGIVTLTDTALTSAIISDSAG